MNQAPAEKPQIPVYYNADYINSLLEASEHTQEGLAYLCRRSPTTVSLVLKGKATTFGPVYDVIRVLKGSYERAFMGLSKSQNHRAAMPNEKSGGGAVSGRSGRGDGAGRSNHRFR